MIDFLPAFPVRRLRYRSLFHRLFPHLFAEEVLQAGDGLEGAGIVCLLF